MHDTETKSTGEAHGTTHEKDTVTEFYKAQAKHDRQLNRLTKKILCKWKAKDFAAIRATRAARDSAVAALSYADKLRHFHGLTKEHAAHRAAEAKRDHERVEQLIAAQGVQSKRAVA